MRMTKRTTRRIAAAALAFLIARPALAQDGTELDRAKTFFNAGAQAYAAGQYAAATQAFEEAYKLAPRPQLLFSIAQALRKQYYVGQDVAIARSAIKHYRDYLDQVPASGRRADAADAIAELEPRVARVEAAGETPPPAKTEIDRTRILVTSETPGAWVTIDDTPPALAPHVAAVKAGNHRVRVSSEGYFDDERYVVALKDALIPADVPLREKPASVSFAGADGADVTVDGRLVGIAPLSRPIELAPGNHAITFTKNGCRAATLSPKLIHGQHVTLRVVLERSGQRFASYVLLGSGAAIAVAGGVFAGVALVRQSDAQRILDAKGRGNIDGTGLADYNASIDARDTWRVASATALGIGAAVIATGAFLFAFDHPFVSALPPDEDAPAPPLPPRAPLEISLAPIVAPGVHGAAFGARF